MIAKSAASIFPRRSQPEWPQKLNVDRVSAEGWQPTPFHSFVLKIHSRCDLACDYCYMYQSADQSWRTQPRRMSRPVVEWTAQRIAEHVGRHQLPKTKIVLHGGEPLLAGPELIEFTVRTIRAAVDVPVHVAIQTNGMRLTDAYLELLAGLDVKIGISLDGTERGHDRHRRRADGSGSHSLVSAAVRRLVEGEHRHLFGGLLCTIDLRNDPVETYEALLEHRPPSIDFLLPHGNWSSPPPGLVPGSGTTPYADWLIRAFERWYGAPVRETRVRIFQEVMRLLVGGRARVEGFGLEPVRYLVVETDGAIGQNDALRTTYPGAMRLPLHVARDSFDQALRQPGIVARQLGVDALSGVCATCPVVRVCGGGHYVHRYREGTGFLNPSVYCPDLAALIAHLKGRLDQDVAMLREAASSFGDGAYEGSHIEESGSEYLEAPLLERVEGE